MAWSVPLSASKAANTVLLPLAGIFIGLTFAWAGNAQALLQSSEIDDLTKYHPGGFEEFVHVFQLAILVLLGTLVGWGIAGLEVFDATWPTPHRIRTYFAVRSTLYASASIALRECWHVVLGSQLLLLVQRRIRSARGSGNDESASSDQ